MKRLRNVFFWSKMLQMVIDMVRKCFVCQEYKSSTQTPSDLLQQLNIPEKVWMEIYMDFITRLPKSNGKDCIMVVVDCLSKASHFILTTSDYTAELAARLYFDNVFKHHGLPTSILCDRDKVFTSIFWKEPFGLQEN